jgi:hypothetical protein
MTRGIRKVWRASLLLWIGVAAVVSFNTAAAMLRSEALTYAALALTGMFALVGIGFGLWAGRTLAKDAGAAG